MYPDYVNFANLSHLPKYALFKERKSFEGNNTAEYTRDNKSTLEIGESVCFMPESPEFQGAKLIMKRPFCSRQTFLNLIKN